MSKTSELVDRLRNGKNNPDDNLRWHVTDIHLEAADLLEAQAKAIEEMRGVLKQCHAALTTLTRPDAIASTTVGAAWAECVAAETAARKVLDHSKGGE